MLLQTTNLTVNYGNIRALDAVSIGIAEGELTALLGANGAGKTTLLKTISRLLKPVSGSMLYHGQKPYENAVLEKLPPEQVVKAGIAQCPEGRKVFPRQTVYENLKMGAYVRSDNEIEDDIDQMLERFPRLKERRNHLAGHLSGGEQQMLVICRALLSRPRLLLLDEPSMGLSPFVVRDVFKIIEAIKAQGTTILLVEQNAKQALKIANHAYILEVGRIIIEDDAKALLRTESIKKSYLGG